MSSLRIALVVGVKLTLTAFATWLILRGVGLRLADVRAIDPGALEFHPFRIVASVLLLFAAQAQVAWIWASLVHVLGGPRIRIHHAIAMVWVSAMGRYIPGKVFQLVGLAMLGKRYGVPASIATSAAMLSQVLNLGAAALLGGGLMAQSAAVPRGWAVGALIAIIVLMVVLSFNGAIRGVLTRVMGRRMGSSEAPLQLPERSLLPWLALYVLNWLILGIAFYFLIEGLGVNVSLALVATAFAAAYLLGYLALFAPAGIGVREGFLVAFLGPVIGSPAALSVAAAQRVWFTAAELISALVGWVILRRAKPSQSGASR